MSKRTPCFTRQRPAFTLSFVRGFTVIEVMIVLALVGILASLALPSYFDSIRKSRRGEGVAALIAVQQAQERHRANQPAYTTDLTSAAGLGLAASTRSGHYALTIDSADGLGYTASARAAGAQAADAPCATLRVRLLRGNIFYGSACADCTMAEPLTDPQRCWSRQ